MKRVLSAISDGLALWVILGALSAYSWPEAFAWTGWPLRYFLGGFLFAGEPAAAASRFDLLGQPTFMWMFALTMFAVGTVIDPKHFVYLLRRPLSILFGLLTQFTVMPTLAWLTAKFGGFDDDVALGFLVVGCAPGAITSNVLTYLAKGDTAYSVTLTTVASILAVFLTPLLILWLAAEELGMTVDAFWSQIWIIAWTIAAPLALGFALRVLFPSLRRHYDAISPALAVVGIVMICCFVIQWTRDHLAEATVWIFLGVVAINALGFLFGHFLGKLYRLSRAQQITLSIEVGMQNAGMGVVLAASTFADRQAVAIPAALFSIWCILTAATLIAWFKRRDTYIEESTKKRARR